MASESDDTMHAPALIPEFLVLYPKIALDIFLQDKRVNSIGEGVDISIGKMSDADSRLIGRK